MFAILYQEFKLLQKIMQDPSLKNIFSISENSQKNFPDFTF